MVLRTLLFFVLWLPLSAAIGMLALPALASTRLTWRVADGWCWLTLGWLRVACGIYSECRGGEALPRTRVIYASKHQSAWDTLMLWRCLNRPQFILKRELYWIPFFGWYLWRSEQIAINRRARKEAMATIIARAQEARRSARPLVIFPEGTRGKVGAETLYHGGVAKLSHALGWPVIPVALNAGKFWPKRPIWKKPGTAVMEFLPMLPACGEDKAAWLAVLKERIETASAKL
jgi:1-acyl-sn-glycerol-3-phosphate acyltransferase